jgi:hypothetical protein
VECVGLYNQAPKKVVMKWSWARPRRMISRKRAFLKVTIYIFVPGEKSNYEKIQPFCGPQYCSLPQEGKME